MDARRVGLLGGGQLGRMLVESANRLNIHVNVLDSATAPAKQLAAHDGHIDGSFRDPAAIRRLAQDSDVLTVEIEHVDTDVLEKIAAEENVVVQPHPHTLAIIKDKLWQKRHLKAHNIPVVGSIQVDQLLEDEARAIGSRLGYPFMLKRRTDAYDGRGNFAVWDENQTAAAARALSGSALYAERWAQFRCELAVMVVKTKDGAYAFPTVETVHENSICKVVYAPPRGVSLATADRARELAVRAVDTLEGKGVFGVEMFLETTNEGSPPSETLLVNEIAPRPHNSGHYTIEACPLSQFDAHLRAILDLPVPEAGLRLRDPAIMLNLLGDEAQPHLDVARRALELPGASLHLYAKGDARPGRKMGHITLTAPTLAEAELQIAPLLDAADKAVCRAPAMVRDPSSPPGDPLVAVIMGSDSDLPVLRPGLETLTQLLIPFTVRITSAHRTPDHLRDFARAAASTSLRVIVAAAGGAAHLPGMCASWTPLPVVGLPVRASALGGVDSLVSMTQMPRGEPVATVGVNNAVNAALLAARILAASDLRVRARVQGRLAAAEADSLAKDAHLVRTGWLACLANMGK